MQIEKRGLNRPPASSAPFRGKRIWRKFHLGGFHQRGSICPVWFESWQGKFAGGSNFCQKPRGFKQTSETGRRLLCKLKTDNQPCPCISFTLLFHSDLWEQIQAWNVCLVQIIHSSPNTCHFVKTSRVCHFWPPSISSSSSLHGQDRPFVFGHWGCSSVLQPSHLIVEVAGKTIWFD